eukprot:scaffold131195_cov81-Phaeocystis_antarctica.AAC.1
MARLHASLRGGLVAVQQAAHVRARDAEASVRLLERRLDSGRVGLRARGESARGLVVDRLAEKHVVADRLGRFKVAS